MSNDNFKVDLTNCDKEPIHLINKLQPHGAMIVAGSTGRIEQVSNNIPAFLRLESGQLFGQKLEDILKGDVLKQNPLTIGDNIFFTHISGQKIIVEIERRPDESTTVLGELQLLSEFITGMNAAESLERAGDLLVETVQQYLDYDRVMIHKFNEEWHGEVVAEKVKPGVASYYQHHFPASDIPAQARAMLFEKGSRQVPDIDCTPAHLIQSEGSDSKDPIDLLRSELRYPSVIHLEFLRNMRVQATFTVSIIAHGRLWGIIACQHESRISIDYRRRKMCELMGKYFAVYLEGEKEKVDQEELRLYKHHMSELLKRIRLHRSIYEGLSISGNELLNITSAKGVAIFYGNYMMTSGIVPQENEVLDLIDWLVEKDIDESYYTNNLSAFYMPAAGFSETGSGILAITIHKLSREFVIWFRPEIKATRIWAGDPNKPVIVESGRLHPRKSFEKWKEEVKGKSEPWTLSELNIAHELRHELINLKISYQNDQLLKALEDISRVQSELKESNKKLQTANKELEGFAYTVSHDLRSPLTSIIGATSMITTGLKDKVDPQVLKLIEITYAQAKRMNDLIQEVLNYAKSGLVWSKKEKINMNELIDTLKRDFNLPPYFVLSTNVLPTVMYNKVQLSQVLQNLVDNARKYNDKPEGRISLTATEKPKEWEIAVADNGIGIEEKNFHKIFEAFGTAHGTERKDSTGLGLAIVKKIIETNGGRIWFTSKPGEGTTFTFTIPKR